ncbi:unnamed protein product [Amaranthus hypochondriacus]
MEVPFCRQFLDRFSDLCLGSFPCLSDPVRRSSICLKITLVMIHFIYLGVLFFVDQHNLIQTANRDPWYIGLYLLLFVATLIQYFITSYSSPGYVLDAMRAVNEGHSHATLVTPIQPATSKNGSFTIPIDGDPPARNLIGSAWMKLVMNMYPPRSSMRQLTCTYCNVLQPPRAKHCHDCDKCVLQFDHHCVWLGTCIGQGNHCRFWWYICEETALCLWTSILYASYLKANISRSWWMGAMMIILLVTLSISLIFLILLLIFHSYLVLTNQTTYELVRRRRIPYMRTVPERVYPFSNGMCRNLYNFCCAKMSIYSLERLPTVEELEFKRRRRSCSQILC